MRQVTEKLETPGADAPLKLTLPYDQRQKSRFRATLDDGSEVAVHLPRGTVLRGGDCLRAEDGVLIAVVAAPETVSTALSEDALQLTRAAYHLGNRHVLLEVGAGWVRYQHDHVLDQMVAALGLELRCEQAPFEPEGGAYAAGHAHGHGHGHHHHDDHHHAHDHGHHHGHHHA